jgi:hypothetical protein
MTPNSMTVLPKPAATAPTGTSSFDLGGRLRFSHLDCDETAAAEVSSGLEIRNLEQPLGYSGCRAVVVLLSHAAFGRNWAEQRRELADVAGGDQSVAVIPVRIDDCEVPDIPVGADRSLADLHRIDLFPDFDRGIDQLATALRR